MVANQHYQLFVSVQWYGEFGYFKIATGSRLDLALTAAGLRSGLLPQLRKTDSFAVHECEEITILGKHRPAGEVTAFDHGSTGNVFGSLGSLFFKGAALVLDPAEPAALITDNWEEVLPGRSHAPARIIGNSGLPISSDFGIPEVGAAVVTLLDSGVATSYIVGSALPGFREKDGSRRVTVVSPSGHEQSILANVFTEGPTYAVDMPKPIQVVLGADYLRTQMTVIDYLGGQIHCCSYPLPK